MKNKSYQYMIRNELLLIILILATIGGGIYLFHKQNIILTALMSIITIFILYLGTTGNKEEIMYFIVAFIIGGVGDIIISRIGAWKFNNPNFFGIPTWLPLSWGLTAVLFKKIVTLTKNYSKKDQNQ